MELQSEVAETRLQKVIRKPPETRLDQTTSFSINCISLSRALPLKIQFTWRKHTIFTIINLSSSLTVRLNIF